MVEAAAFDELHGNEGRVIFVAQFVDGHDIGMLESASRARFLIEALERIGLRAQAARDGLQSDEPADKRVAGLINRAHRPAANFGDDFVFA